MTTLPIDSFFLFLTTTLLTASVVVVVYFFDIVSQIMFVLERGRIVQWSPRRDADFGPEPNSIANARSTPTPILFHTRVNYTIQITVDSIEIIN